MNVGVDERAPFALLPGPTDTRLEERHGARA
jgi:hypothetical protein